MTGRKEIKLKPFLIRKFSLNSLLDWKGLETIIKESADEDFEVINSNKRSNRAKRDEVIKNSLILSHCKKFLDCSFIKEFVDNNNYFTYSRWDAHIYASYYKTSYSFSKHFDYAHNFIIPQHGKSRWIVSNFCDTILKPGDMLYIPCKWEHECIPSEKRISVSFPFWPVDNEQR